MAADIYTKGFTSAELYWRLRRLINVYTTAEVDGGHWSPEPKMSDGTPAYDYEEFDPYQINSQYQIIMAMDDSMTDTRKPVKQKPKSKAKAKSKAKFIGEVEHSGTVQTWFARIDHQVSHLQLPPDDPRCPRGSAVKLRRTLDIRKQKLIKSDKCNGLTHKDCHTISDIENKCDIATFFYTNDGLSIQSM